MKMIEEPMVLREIHEIRLKLYEEREKSNMTDEEWVIDVNKHSQEAAEKYRFKIVKSTH